MYREIGGNDHNLHYRTMDSKILKAKNLSIPYLQRKYELSHEGAKKLFEDWKKRKEDKR